MTRIFILLLACLAVAASVFSPAQAADGAGLFAQENLVAWCIVPFDAGKRGPEERAAMLEGLGIRKLAYDYRAEHVPTFDAEMDALKKHGIELTAWWFPTELNAEARLILDVIKRHGVHPQLWVMGGGGPVKDEAEQRARVEAEAGRIRPIAEEAGKAGCQVALYNHGSWFGEPENQLQVIDRLSRDGVTNVGIVYNQHHGHEHLDRFPALLEKMKPHLLALNLNGMTRHREPNGEIILPLGQGELDTGLLQVIRDSGWRGPVGLLNHTNEDAEARLRDNLDGLRWLVKELEKPGSGGAKPKPRSWKGPAEPQLKASLSPAFGRALEGGMVVESRPEFRTPPLTLECRVRLDNAANFNIIAASDTKASGQHWELFTFAGKGTLAAYLPGRSPDHARSDVAICDGQWHQLVMHCEADRVRLHVDGKLVADQVMKATGKPAVPGGLGGLGFGRLVEGGLGCAGMLDEVRISRGLRPVTLGDAPLKVDETTLGLWNFDEAGTTAPAPTAAEFPHDRAPLQPELWPNWKEPVNRERDYDFYAKEADYFRTQNPRPALLPEFPGLDGGTHGHWGNQTEEVWRDASWNKTNLGSLMGGVFRGAGLTVPKAVCVRLGADGGASACFDPATLTWPLVWRGGFVGFGDTRHGLMDGIQLRGEVVEKPAATPPAQPFTYHGFYRHGDRVLFSYRLGGVEMLDSGWVEGGQFVRQQMPAVEHPLREMTRGGPPQWPQVLETKGTLGTGAPYAVDTLTLPFANPWGTIFLAAGHDFFRNGDAALCTMTGEVWRVSGVDEKLDHLRWRRMAAGLHQPLGLVMVDDEVCVLGRDQITRLHDLNGDGEADFYECVTNGYTTSKGGHDFTCDLQRDAEGRFYSVASHLGVFRITPGSPPEILATGFRNPNGLGLGPDGTVTTSVQEGDWTPASQIFQIKPGSYYGYPGPKPGRVTEPPLLYLPRGVDNSSASQVWVDGDRWGPLRGQMIHLSHGAGTHFLVLRDNVDGVWQGAAVPLAGDFRAGIHRGRFSPHDGQLYVSGMTGWGTYTPDDGCLQRVRYTGGPVHLPVTCQARENGVLLTFTEPLDAGVAGLAGSHFAQAWNYLYRAAYGSSEYSAALPGTPGHDPLEITSARVLGDGRTLFLEIPQLQPVNQLHLRLALTPSLKRDAFLTIHRLGPPFTDFPGYQPVVKKAAPAAAPVAAAPAARLNPWLAGPAGRPVRLDAANGLQFATKELRAAPGERLSLTFANPDVVPHNWALLRPGSMEKVGDLANKLITDPAGAARHYVPDVPEVLVYADMTQPGGSFTIHFTAPREKGSYPYICSFPGHWMVMKGVLVVE